MLSSQMIFFSKLRLSGVINQILLWCMTHFFIENRSGHTDNLKGSVGALLQNHLLICGGVNFRKIGVNHFQDICIIGQPKV